MEQTPESKSQSVLLAEDNRINQKLMTLMLGKIGVNTTVVNNGKEAVEAATANGFDLILMDLHMPVMDGLEATMHIKEQLGENAPPIVALTADAMQGSIEEALSMGLDGYLTKPINSETLKACVRQYIPE